MKFLYWMGRKCWIRREGRKRVRKPGIEAVGFPQRLHKMVWLLLLLCSELHLGSPLAYLRGWGARQSCWIWKSWVFNLLAGFSCSQQPQTAFTLACKVFLIWLISMFSSEYQAHTMDSLWVWLCGFTNLLNLYKLVWIYSFIPRPWRYRDDWSMVSALEENSVE